MLALPSSGMARSVGSHNIDLDNLCDWIEASSVFADERISTSDVIDILIEEEIYEDQDFAQEIVEEAWETLRFRVEHLSEPLGMKVTKTNISRRESWEEFPAYGFCLALACGRIYPTWNKDWDYLILGDLFEELTKESLSLILSGWSVKRIGWAPGQPTKLHSIILEIIANLGEVAGSELETHVTAHANELGLDILAFRGFEDNKGSIPIIMCQCACGQHWKNKRGTPDLTIWSKIISFNSQPVKAFAMPFAYADSQNFRKETAAVNGVFIDRYRLLRAFTKGRKTLSKKLKTSLINNLTPLLDNIPMADD